MLRNSNGLKIIIYSRKTQKWLPTDSQLNLDIILAPVGASKDSNPKSLMASYATGKFYMNEYDSGYWYTYYVLLTAIFSSNND